MRGSVVGVLVILLTLTAEVKTVTVTSTPTATPTPTVSDTLSDTPSPTPSDTPSASITLTSTASPTPTPSSTPTLTSTETLSLTPTPTLTLSPTLTLTPTPTISPTQSPSESPSLTPTETPTVSPTQSPSESPSLTPTETPTGSLSPTPTDTPTSTKTARRGTPTATVTATPSPTPTDTMSLSPTSTHTGTPTETPSFTETRTATITPTPTFTLTDTLTLSPTATNTAAIPRRAGTATPSPTATATITMTITVTRSPTPTFTRTPSPTYTSTLTIIPTLSASPTSTRTPMAACPISISGATGFPLVINDVYNPQASSYNGRIMFQGQRNRNYLVYYAALVPGTTNFFAGWVVLDPSLTFAYAANPGNAALPNLLVDTWAVNITNIFYLDYSVTSKCFDPGNSICLNTTFTASTGILHHGNSSGPYTNNMNCRSLIQAPAGQGIVLTITQFESENGYDYLTIYNGSSTSARQLARLTGTYYPLPGPFYSTDNTVFLVFTTDWSVVRNGFSLTWFFRTICQNTEATCICDVGKWGTFCDKTCPGLLYSGSKIVSACWGHGNCSTVTGQCRCFAGFLGSECALSCKTDAYGVTCGGNGNCTLGSNSSAVCSCYDGYRGENCTQGCKTSPTGCNGHGTCLSNGFCQCTASATAGWFAGEFCEYCEPGYFTPMCNVSCPGFPNNTCNGHGICNGPYGVLSNFSTAPSCNCYENNFDGYWGGPGCFTCITNYYGSRCSLECPPSACAACSGHGTCDSGVKGTGECKCFSNATHGFFDGRYCDQCQTNYGSNGNKLCTVSCGQTGNGTVCAGHGTCTWGIAFYPYCVCSGNWNPVTSCSSCLSGYYGSQCSFECPGGASNPCSNRGTCTSNGTCLCNAGAGLACELACAVADTTFNYAVCGRGTCNMATGQCDCIRSAQLGYWDGAACDKCLAGFYGPNCTNACPGTRNGTLFKICYGHGTCSDGRKGTGDCTCTTGYAFQFFASYLNVPTPCALACPGGLEGNPCGGHGQCFGNLDAQPPFATCQCSADLISGYWSVSSNCTLCDDPYSGPNCTLACPYEPSYNATPRACTGHGSCRNGTCFCTPGFCGLDCSSTASCGCPTPSGVCLTGGGGSPVCSGHGNCSSSGSACVCLCSDGYGGPSCNLTCPQFEGLACGGKYRGLCNSDVGTCTCLSSKWQGVRCSVPDCGVGGTGYENGTCVCSEGYSSTTTARTDCDIRCNATTQCNDHGRCVISYDSITSAVIKSCECFSDDIRGHWAGSDCLLCQNGFTHLNGAANCLGKCAHFQAGGLTLTTMCTCKEGWKGFLCDIACPGCTTDTCNSTQICAGHGTCSLPSGSLRAVCECSATYYPSLTDCIDNATCCGTRCTAEKCKDKQHRACNAMGECDCAQNAQDGYWLQPLCEICDPHWFGKNCTYACTQCSDHGVCNQAGDCLCYNNDTLGHFAGRLCQVCAEGYVGFYCTEKESLLSRAGEMRRQSVTIADDAVGMVLLDAQLNVLYVGGNPLVVMENTPQTDMADYSEEIPLDGPCVFGWITSRYVYIATKPTTVDQNQTSYKYYQSVRTGILHQIEFRPIVVSSTTITSKAYHPLDTTTAPITLPSTRLTFDGMVYLIYLDKVAWHPADLPPTITLITISLGVKDVTEIGGAVVLNGQLIVGGMVTQTTQQIAPGSIQPITITQYLWVAQRASLPLQSTTTFSSLLDTFQASVFGTGWNNNSVCGAKSPLKSQCNSLNALEGDAATNTLYGVAVYSISSASLFGALLVSYNFDTRLWREEILATSRDKKPAISALALDSFAGIGYVAITKPNQPTVLYKFWMARGRVLPVFGKLGFDATDSTAETIRDLAIDQASRTLLAYVALSATSGAALPPSRPVQLTRVALWVVERMVPDWAAGEGNTSVIVIGAGFANTTDLSTLSVICRYGDTKNTSGVFLNRTAVLCVTDIADNELRNGHVVEIGLAPNLTISGAGFAVSNDSMVFSASNIRLNRAMAPVVTTVSPWQWPYNASNQWITVSGMSFVESNYTICRFGPVSNDTSSFVYGSSVFDTGQQIRCFVPAVLAPSPPNCLMHVSIDGQIYMTANQRFEFVGPPKKFLVLKKDDHDALETQKTTLHSSIVDTTTFATLDILSDSLVTQNETLFDPMYIHFLDAQSHEVGALYNSTTRGLAFQVTLLREINYLNGSAVQLTPVPLKSLGTLLYQGRVVGDTGDSSFVVTMAGAASCTTANHGLAVANSSNGGCALIAPLVVRTPKAGNYRFRFSELSLAGIPKLFTEDVWLRFTIVAGVEYELILVEQPRLEPDTSYSVVTKGKFGKFNGQFVISVVDVATNIISQKTHIIKAVVQVKPGTPPERTTSTILKAQISEGDTVPTPLQGNYTFLPTVEYFKHSVAYVVVFGIYEPGTLTMRLNKTSTEVRLQNCAAQELAIRNTSDCVPCPDHATCNGSAEIEVCAGYWFQPVSEGLYTPNLTLCPSPIACLGHPDKMVSKGTCMYEPTEKYTGPFCGVCEEGHGRGMDGRCGRCLGTGYIVGVFIAVIIAAAILITAYCYFAVAGPSEEEKAKAAEQDQQPDTGSLFPLTLKALVNYLQVSSKFGNFKVAFPWVVRQFFGTQKAIAISSPSLLALDCATGWGVYGKFIMFMAMPGLLMILAIPVGWIIDTVRAPANGPGIVAQIWVRIKAFCCCACCCACACCKSEPGDTPCYVGLCQKMQWLFCCCCFGGCNKCCPLEKPQEEGAKKKVAPITGITIYPAQPLHQRNFQSQYPEPSGQMGVILPSMSRTLTTEFVSTVADKNKVIPAFVAALNAVLAAHRLALATPSKALTDSDIKLLQWSSGAIAAGRDVVQWKFTESVSAADQATLVNLIQERGSEVSEWLFHNQRNYAITPVVGGDPKSYLKFGQIESRTITTEFECEVVNKTHVVPGLATAINAVLAAHHITLSNTLTENDLKLDNHWTEGKLGVGHEVAHWRFAESVSAPDQAVLIKVLQTYGSEIVDWMCSSESMHRRGFMPKLVAHPQTRNFFGGIESRTITVQFESAVNHKELVAPGLVAAIKPVLAAHNPTLSEYLKATDLELQPWRVGKSVDGHVVVALKFAESVKDQDTLVQFLQEHGLEIAERLSSSESTRQRGVLPKIVGELKTTKYFAEIEPRTFTVEFESAVDNKPLVIPGLVTAINAVLAKHTVILSTILTKSGIKLLQWTEGKGADGRSGAHLMFTESVSAADLEVLAELFHEHWSELAESLSSSESTNERGFLPKMVEDPTTAKYFGEIKSRTFTTEFQGFVANKAHAASYLVAAIKEVAEPHFKTFTESNLKLLLWTEGKFGADNETAYWMFADSPLAENQDKLAAQNQEKLAEFLQRSGSKVADALVSRKNTFKRGFLPKVAVNPKTAMYFGGIDLSSESRTITIEFQTASRTKDHAIGKKALVVPALAAAMNAVLAANHLALSNTLTEYDLKLLKWSEGETSGHEVAHWLFADSVSKADQAVCLKLLEDHGQEVGYWLTLSQTTYDLPLVVADAKTKLYFGEPGCWEKLKAVVAKYAPTWYGVVVVLLFLVYTLLVEQCAQIFDCRKLPVGAEIVNTLWAQTTISCDAYPHNVYKGLAAFFGFLYCFGIPCLPVIGYRWIRWLKKDQPKEAELEAERIFRFMTFGYSDEHRYWESLIMVRKAMMVIIAVYVRDPAMQVYCAMWLIETSLILNFIFQPWGHRPRIKSLKYLDMISLGAMLVTLNIALLFFYPNALGGVRSNSNQCENVDEVVNQNGWWYILLIILIAVNAILLLVFFNYLLKQGVLFLVTKLVSVINAITAPCLKACMRKAWFKDDEEMIRAVEGCTWTLAVKIYTVITKVWRWISGKVGKMAEKVVDLCCICWCWCCCCCRCCRPKRRDEAERSTKHIIDTKKDRPSKYVGEGYVFGPAEKVDFSPTGSPSATRVWGDASMAGSAWFNASVSPASMNLTKSQWISGVGGGRKDKFMMGTGVFPRSKGYRRNGQGFVRLRNGDTYKGEFKDDMRHGFGVYTAATSKTIYEGQWRNDQRDGHGKASFADGSTYEGYFANDQYNGEGTYHFGNGSRYVGRWKDNRMDGYGVMRYKDGTVYEGFWRKGKRDGASTFKALDTAKADQSGQLQYKHKDENPEMVRYAKWTKDKLSGDFLKDQHLQKHKVHRTRVRFVDGSLPFNVGDFHEEDEEEDHDTEVPAIRPQMDGYMDSSSQGVVNAPHIDTEMATQTPDDWEVFYEDVEKGFGASVMMPAEEERGRLSPAPPLQRPIRAPVPDPVPTSAPAPAPAPAPTLQPPKASALLAWQRGPGGESSPMTLQQHQPVRATVMPRVPVGPDQEVGPIPTPLQNHPSAYTSPALGNQYRARPLTYDAGFPQGPHTPIQQPQPHPFAYTGSPSAWWATSPAARLSPPPPPPPTTVYRVGASDMKLTDA